MSRSKVNLATNVLIVDDHQLAAKGAQAILSGHKDIKVVGCVHCGKDALDFLANNLDVSIVLLDLDLGPHPGNSEDGRPLHGETVTSIIGTEQPNVAVVILSKYKHAGAVKRARKAGAVGYVTNNDGPEEILRAIRSVRATGTYFSPTVRELEERNEQIEFTEIQLQHAKCYARDESLKESARNLKRSVDLIRATRRRIKEIICPHDPESVGPGTVKEYLIRIGEIKLGL